jgi:hypothetical protein
MRDNESTFSLNIMPSGINEEASRLMFRPSCNGIASVEGHVEVPGVDACHEVGSQPHCLKLFKKLANLAECRYHAARKD